MWNLNSRMSMSIENTCKKKREQKITCKIIKSDMSGPVSFSLSEEGEIAL